MSLREVLSQSPFESLFDRLVNFFIYWANGGKKKGSDTTTRTGIETAGSGKDLGFWLEEEEDSACPVLLEGLPCA